MKKCYVCEEKIKTGKEEKVGNIYLCPECAEDHYANEGHKDGSVNS